MSKPASFSLPVQRLEDQFLDKKPLYDASEATQEANRCLYCSDAPCIAACPTGIDIPTFIHKISTGNVKGAARTILSANILGNSCAQACPVEVLCAGACVHNHWEREPIAIGRLQRYAVETTLATKPKLFQAKPATGKSVALVGSGPASIAAAGLLALEGHRCVIFEKKQIPYGLNSLGIAPYKMKAHEALREMEWVLSLGNIELRCGVEIVEKASGQHQVSAADLLREYDAVFLGLGLGADSKLNVPGEDGPGVHGATALIEQLKSDPGLSLGQAKRAVVVGGGNTALDIAHELQLLGLDVSMVYRRGEAEMSGYEHELEAARKDGVKLIENRQPVEIIREDGAVSGILVAVAKDGKPLPQSEEMLPAELIAVAIGQNRATAIARAFGAEVDGKGRVMVDPETHRSTHAKVWSGGDCVNGGKEVVNAVAEAKVAVKDMLRVLGASAGKVS